MEIYLPVSVDPDDGHWRSCFCSYLAGAGARCFSLSMVGSFRLCSHVKEVKENFGSKPRVITLTLNQPSKFGGKVLFVPAPLSFGPFRSHPVVEQLRKLITSNQVSIPEIHEV